MKVLIDIGHPAHVHFFKNAIWKLQSKGHEVLITTRDKEVTFDLLDAYGFRYINLGKNRKGLVNKAIGMVKTDFQLYKIAKKYNPDVLTGIHNPYVAHIGKVLKKPSLIFTDTEHAKLANSLTFPFATTICTPSCFKGDLGSKHIRYNGYHELAYLHPNYFKPDSVVLGELGLKETDPFIVLRFVAWNASHDVGHTGISIDMMRRFVREFGIYGRIVITSENELPTEFEPYRLKVAPEKMHNLLYYAALLVGESATMASECAVLGTPAIFIDFAGRGYTDEQENEYGLVYNFKNNKIGYGNAIIKSIQLLKNKNLKEHYSNKAKALIDEKIDVTKFMVEIIESNSPLILSSNDVEKWQ